MRGAIAAGHEQTAEAAMRTFEAGGNAFDAAVAACFAACVVEPVLSSLGGGGFLMARDERGDIRLFDFFAHTPKTRAAAEAIDFHPILADFGTAQQEFHIGMGAIAVPGTLRGLFDIHRRLGSLEMQQILRPAIEYAREGTALTALQAYIFRVVAPIYRFSAEARANYASPVDPGRLPEEGEILRQADLADTLEQIQREGDRLLYEGELGQQLVDQCQHQGGHLRREDLQQYQTLQRKPLVQAHRGYQLHTNPPPSSGGLLIGFALELLNEHRLDTQGFGSAHHLRLLAGAMAQTNLARNELNARADSTLLQRYRAALRGHLQSARGTSHISLVDEQGNAAALTLSNGEGCGHMLGSSGIMPNNMLGEADLNPLGLNRWPCDRRVSSMMAPSLLTGQDRLIVTGSGGSNRLRSAILQTLINRVDFGLSIEQAVNAPRIHLEADRISIEPGFSEEALAALIEMHPEHQLWDDLNLFFGGCHSLERSGSRVDGAGDPRRGGVFRSNMP